MSQRPITVPANINFNAQHAPMGAFMSFTCGHFGSGGGIGVEIGRPADQNLCIGVKEGDRKAQAPIRCLPFLRSTSPLGQNAANFLGEHATSVSRDRLYDTYEAHQIQREYGWATDTWVTPDFSFAVYTPFGSIPEPDSTDQSLRNALLPAVIATLTVDNRNGSSAKTAVFAIDFGTPGARVLKSPPTAGQLGDQVRTMGFAWRRSMGVLGTVEGSGLGNGSDRSDLGLYAVQRWSVAESLTDVNPVHLLGTAPGLVMEVPPGECRTLVLSIGVFLNDVVTTGLEGRYFYTRSYSSLTDVLSSALQRSRELRARSAELDNELLDSGTSADQQFMIAHATRSYYGSTQLLDIGGEPFWVVNEGEYCMMNTLDLSVDQVFWELHHNPWVVKNLLNNFARSYAYDDQVQLSSTAGFGGPLKPGGVSFAHDMGVNNNFSPPQQSSYELANLRGCFSFMTMEQLCNWVLTAACYVVKTGDTRWLLDNTPLLDACFESLLARSDPKTGVMAYDTNLCRGGWEITTYDSLDESLGQARGNTYLGVKAWSAAVCLDALSQLRSTALGVRPLTSSRLREFADRLAGTLIQAVKPDGTLPAVLEENSPGYHSRIFAVAEGLVYLSYSLNALSTWSPNVASEAQAVLSSALTHPLIATLRRHTATLLKDPQRRNLFEDGGIKLSSTSNNSWMSKIALFTHVCRAVLRMDQVDASIADLLNKADAAQVVWQTDGSGYWACSDQFINGKAVGSRYYPRLVTAALWLSESPSQNPTDGVPPPFIASSSRH